MIHFSDPSTDCFLEDCWANDEVWPAVEMLETLVVKADEEPISKLIFFTIGLYVPPIVFLCVIVELAAKLVLPVMPDTNKLGDVRFSLL